MVYGIDLVREQIRIAAGEKLSFGQNDVVARGHAIECRINAEDGNFAPAAGTLRDVVWPGGLGVRVDAHAYAGLQIPPYYDSLLAKIVTHGETREEALTRMDVALRETRVVGVNTTVAACQAIVRDPRFRAGGVSIDYLSGLAATLAAAGS